jgi:hypothetical protein
LNEVQGLILVFSMTSMQSLKQLAKYREQIFVAKGVSKLPSVLIGCKNDLPQRIHQVTDADVREFKTKYGCSFAMTISVFDDLDFTKCITTLIQEIKQSQSVELIFGEFDRYGLLSKISRSLSHKKVKSRIVLISDGYLYITSDGIATPKSSKIQLSEDTTVETLPTDPVSKMFPFEIRNASGKYYFSASSDEERASWVETIIMNTSAAYVGSSFLDDVVKVLLWEILSSPDLHAVDPMDSEK